MRVLYNIGIFFYGLIIKLLAAFNTKAKLFINGRKGIFTQIQNRLKPEDNPIWFHFASLGEFEQGRPVLEKLKSQLASTKIIITFFSPSGYEIRKNYPLADGIFYLPLDTPHNAKKFIETVNPKMAVFTKYEFWPNYFEALYTKHIPLYVISGIFRKNQIFFKWYGTFYRNVLKCVSHFFVQNKESLLLLNKIGLNNVDISGDTRFDRVYENAQNPKDLPIIKAFCEQSPILVAGSTWPDDEKLLVDLAEQNPDWKLIIAPHEIHETHINAITTLFPNSVKFSDLRTSKANRQTQTLIIDNIGMLSSLYQYGRIAYIGGGFGAGIHNTLEAVAFGMPVIFGPHYHKFQEAKDLIEINAAKSINDRTELAAAFEYFNKNSCGHLAKSYVINNTGATDKILQNIIK
ncbi:3-deoxy-D-manno-octulosonic acid transferase [Pedobacter montanisoli]|uniref:3-deoxy-D-manno-octulosonic acid transferase n=1 Tax=Pedobacter montanisoli TaxID=2923277 RepID=A0ABS9ZW18_9SPHI|nr:glycosyltransferase N-terminal domain-containing protein [Pedobacter montanisoli]MCJ0742497.1 3-deoxy-D-manno-octulosonic acid transferase [Pedobacter montanisoli]